MSGLSIKSLVRSGSAALGVDARQLEQALEQSAHAAGFLGQSSGVAVLLVFLHEGELTTSGGGDCAFPAGARCLYFIRDTEDYNYGTLQAWLQDITPRHALAADHGDLPAMHP